ncbi:hypothetical protein [Anaerospora hongkongensis]|uniref:hypothetical protein n=1 Tax=Anaerospora hongkongensis TaxID=244830 RepID=UPI00289E5F90|nr:hypothetical protein [Anaerospora hongkongensis]
MKAFIKANWRFIIYGGVVLLIAYFIRGEYLEWKQQKQVSIPPIQVAVPPQVIHTNTETVREITVQAPSTPGAVLQFVEKEGKVIAIVNGQEVEVPNLTGKPEVALGDTGELRLTSTTTTRIDVTDMANAQARLIANQELEKQAAVYKKGIDKEKSVRKKERFFWIVGTAGAFMLAK